MTAFKPGDQATYFDPTIPEGYPGSDVWQHQVVTVEEVTPLISAALVLAKAMIGGDVIPVVAGDGTPGFAPVKFLEPVTA